ncbi:MAG: hypothetical protein V4667_13080 [Bacteroidota bacterium]
MIKNLIKSIIPHSILVLKRNITGKAEIEQWRKNGSPTPPPHPLKQVTIRAYKNKFKLSTLIETGTYMGTMVEAQRTYFDKIISIEVSDELYKIVKDKFKQYNHIILFKGDSGEIMPDVLKDIKEPCLFWLDGHYSSGVTGKGELNTPIFKELDAIFANNKNHIILIDDARCFIGEDDYPTIEKLKEYVLKLNPNYHLKSEDDIIRLTPSLN